MCLSIYLPTYLSIYLPFCLCIFLSTYLGFCRSMCFSNLCILSHLSPQSIYLSIYRSFYLSIFLSGHLSFFLLFFLVVSVCCVLSLFFRYIYLSFFLTIYLSSHLVLYLICLPIYLSISLSFYLSSFLIINPIFLIYQYFLLSILSILFIHIYLIYAIYISYLSTYLTIHLSIWNKAETSFKIHSGQIQHFLKNGRSQLQNDEILWDFSIFEVGNIKNEAILNRKSKWSAELTALYQRVLRFFPSIRLKYCPSHEKVRPGHTKCCTCHAKTS